MTQEKEKRRGTPRLAIYATLGLLLVFGLVFVVEFVAASQTPVEGENALVSEQAQTLTAETYMDIVTPLLASGDAENGARLVNEVYECHVCHVTGAGQQAPAYEGLRERAADLRPPLTASAYIYESVVHPSAYLAQDYANAMPQNYAQRLSQQDLADILVFLLAQ